MKLFIYFLWLWPGLISAAPPGLLLANKYHEQINLDDYWVSEKYDGVRAYWNGAQLLSRQGNPINAPAWFTAPLGPEVLDGELWIARGRFDRLSGIIRRHSPDDADWLNIKYMVFDLPTSEEIFDHRLLKLEAILSKIGAGHILLVKQEKVTSHAALMQKLEQTVSAQGEGLMLHRGASYYSNLRSNDLLKLKQYSDAEALVIQHLPGTGKFEGFLGSILVEMPNRKQFKIGSGFSDLQRQNPPPIGAIISYKYYGLTNNGIPRFASFLRVRNQH
ncbi:MAG: DNA ligase [Gammaproteobacteria bacterium]|nr:DNA ligase [Gammaproteobacteria bacterium]